MDKTIEDIVEAAKRNAKEQQDELTRLDQIVYLTLYAPCSTTIH